MSLLEHLPLAPPTVTCQTHDLTGDGNMAIQTAKRPDASTLARHQDRHVGDFVIHCLIAPIGFGVLVLGAWQLATSVLTIQSWLLPSPLEILQTFGANWGLLRDNTGPTLEETVVGFGVALTFAVVLAVVIDASRLLESALYPWLIASQTVPIIAIAPVLVVWFGYTMTPKIIVVALVAFFPIVVNTVDGLKSADPDLINLLRVMGAGRFWIFRHARFPNAMPQMFSGIRIGITLSVIGAILGEWVGASEGLGFVMIQAINQFQTALIFDGILILAVMGVGLFLVVTVLERVLLPWYHTSRRVQSSQR